MAKKQIEKNIITLDRLEVIYVPIDSIKPNTYNPNRQSERDFELLCRSIEEDGFTQPIIVNREKNEIVDGEHRWRALKALGKTEAPIVLVNMTEAQQLISTLRHNRARGTEDISLASDVLKELNIIGNIGEVADSLLLDDIDLQIMLQDIPDAELNLRSPGEKLTAEETEELNRQEEEERKQRREEERLMEVADLKKYTFQFTYEWTEGWLVERIALGRNRNLNKAEELVKLCRDYGNE